MATLNPNYVHGQLSSSVTNTDTVANFADLVLANDEFVYLKVSAPIGVEIMKVSKFNNTLQLLRGQEGTTPLNFPVGSCYESWVGVSAVLFLID